MSMGTALDRSGASRWATRCLARSWSSVPPPPRVYADHWRHAFLRDCAMDTWVHEVGLLSNSSAWVAALAGDSCVPDEYSLTNEVEDFAQVSVLKTYMLLHPGIIPRGFTMDRMTNQLAFMDSLELYDPGALFGNTCHIIDTGPPARHTTPPAMLDPSRTFRTVAPDDTPTSTPAAAAASTPTNSAPIPPIHLRSSVIALVFIASPE
ncbi:hypothetical protein B0H17DRAFT_1333892 [Mycena rosella]|uniref:Uncharacterized protein n=1 Tax=Mycena rosella TaxID=1033263 RepID=A0AAD7G9J4_MYCRO|nr:hypothetical protein B0H17DRAFT_1333892 [Mycena rosella]